MRTTFASFQQKLLISGHEIDENNRMLVDYVPPLDGNDYVIEVDGQRLGVDVIIYDKTNEVVYLPNIDGTVLASDEYWHFNAHEEHDFKLLKISYTEV